MFDKALTAVCDKSLKELSSMKTGGCAKQAYFPEDSCQLAAVVKKLCENDEKFLILGNMSNVLVPDDGFEIPVVITSKMKEIKTVEDTEESVTVYAESGTSVTKLSLEMCKNGFGGLEFAYGIPGTVGGAVYMNAGAYGGEISDVVQKVYCIDKKGKEHIFEKEMCGFDYRHSTFMEKDLVILGASFVLKKTDALQSTSQAKEFMSRRMEKQPLDYPSCGSTFKRPEGYFAGKLIEDSGLKGFAVGGAEVSEKHAGFVINSNNASTKDVIELMRHIQKTVYENFGVKLEPEIRLLDSMGEETEL